MAGALSKRPDFLGPRSRLQFEVTTWFGHEVVVIRDLSSKVTLGRDMVEAGTGWPWS